MYGVVNRVAPTTPYVTGTSPSRYSNRREATTLTKCAMLAPADRRRELCDRLGAAELTLESA